MNGKTCLITGATDGLGRETARALAGMGATVFGVGRSEEKMARVRRAIQQETGSDSVEFLRADLASQADVRALADEFRRKSDRLDVLVNNAGALFTAYRETIDGLEMTFALNHLAYFLLTNLLLDLLKASAPARIVSVASSYQDHPDLNDLQMKENYNGWDAYGRSKYMNILFTVELARRLDGTGVTANTLNPGFIASNFQRAAGLNMRGNLTPEQGAQTQIYLATSPDVANVTGQYFDNKRPARSDALKDTDAARRLWEISAKLTGLDSLPHP
jgi:NAD(P)-dependent dehydrogenase (short-subunit alcohol dehydrogenase family)